MDTRIHSGGFGMAGIITHIIKSDGYQNRQLTNKKTEFNLIQGQSSLISYKLIQSHHTQMAAEDLHPLQGAILWSMKNHT
jgi:hypothetical protein